MYVDSSIVGLNWLVDWGRIGVWETLWLSLTGSISSFLSLVLCFVVEFSYQKWAPPPPSSGVFAFIDLPPAALDQFFSDNANNLLLYFEHNGQYLTKVVGKGKKQKTVYDTHSLTPSTRVTFTSMKTAVTIGWSAKAMKQYVNKNLGWCGKALGK